MTVQGYREIVGDDEFFALRPGDLMRAIRLRQHLTEEFIACVEAVRVARRAAAACSTQYFQQWLYGETEPTIVPADFD